MKTIAMFLLSLSVISSSFLHPVFAENETAVSPNEDTLAEELGIEKKENPDDSADRELNSAILINHLIISSCEAEISENSRLYLEHVLSSISGNLISDALVPEAETKLNQFLDAVQSLRIPEEKADKLRFLYQETQAHALRTLIREPADLLTHSHSFELGDIVNAGLCMPVDSAESYAMIHSPAELFYFQDHPSLSEEQTAVLEEARNSLQLYLEDLVRSADLPEQYVLSPEEASEFAEQRKSGAAQRQQFLTDSADTYSAYPDYWALVAETCYENKDYRQCLSAIETYAQKQAPVYVKDHVYARLIPLAAVCIQETVSIAVTRTQKTEPYMEQLILNTAADDLALRYFAAQSYLDMTRASDNPYAEEKYMNAAYTIIRSAVNHTAEEQRNNNSAYLGDAVQLSAPSGASKDEKKEIRDLNIILKEDRKTALPPVSEALFLSTDLMDALVNESDNEKEETAAVLYPEDTALFLNPYLERLYRQTDEQLPVPEITFDKKKVRVSVLYPAFDYTLKVTAVHGSDTYTLEDWTVSNVKRSDQNDVTSYIAELTSERNDHMKYTEDMQVSVELTPTSLAPCETYTVKYKTVPAKIFFFFNTIRLERAD